MIGPDHEFYVFAFNPDKGSLTEYFLKYSSHILLLFLGKDKHPCTVDEDITIRDHGTCIGGSLTEYFLNYSSHMLLLFLGKGKAFLYG